MEAPKVKLVNVVQNQGLQPTPSREQIGLGYYGFNLPQKLTQEGQIKVDRLVNESLTFFKGLSA